MLASIPGGIGHALNLAFGMAWEILWALILGFALSAVVQSVVPKAEMTNDLIVLPILNIYRKHHGAKASLFLLGTFYATMVGAGLAIEFLFDALGLVPTCPRHAKVVESHISFNYTSVVNLLFLAVGTLLVVRFVRTGGPEMLRHMNGPPSSGEHPSH